MDDPQSLDYMIEISAQVYNLLSLQQATEYGIQ